MARNFNGSASITLSTGGLGTFTFGTMVALCRRTDNNNWHGIIATTQSGGTPEVYLDIAPSSHATAGAIWSSYGGTDNSGTLKFLAADGWCIVAVTKATGSQTPRYHKYVISTATWTHQNGGGAVADGTATSNGNETIGKVDTDLLTGDIQAVAMFTRVLADQEIESLAGSWEVWLSYQPAGAWLLDGDTAVSLIDWTGGGANQSAVTGTSVQTASVPAWNQSDGGWPATTVPAAGGTDATVSAATVAGTATVGSVSLSTGETVSTSTVAGSTAVPTPAMQLGSTVDAGTVAGTAAVGAPTLHTDELVTPATVTGATAVGAPTVTAGQTVSPGTVAGVTAVGSPTLHTGETVSAATVSGAATVPTPSVSTGGSSTVAAATVNGTAAVGAPALHTGETVPAAAVAGAATVGAATVQISVTATPATVAAATTVGAPTAHAGATVAVVTVAVLAAVPAPTLTAAAAALVGVLTASTRPASSQTSTTTIRTGGPT